MPLKGDCPPLIPVTVRVLRSIFCQVSGGGTTPTRSSLGAGGGRLRGARGRCATALLGLGATAVPRADAGLRPWGDRRPTCLAPDGGFEGGRERLVAGRRRDGRPGQRALPGLRPRSLSLPSGSSATSPVICIASNDPFVRLFGADAGGSDGGLHVRVTWYGLLNTVLGITDFTHLRARQRLGAAREARLPVGGGDVPGPAARLDVRADLVQSGRLRQPLAVDDLYVDPWTMRG